MPVHKIAVVGCGGISRAHFTSYAEHRDQVTVVAACDPRAERRSSAEETFGIQRTFHSIAEMVDAGGWDTAVVCTPSSVRLPVVTELAEAGKHVLVEKPLADNADEARQIVDTCAKAGMLLAVNQNFRDQYAFSVGRELVEKGRIGAIIGIDHRDLTFRQDQGWRLDRPRHALAVMGVHWFDGFRVLLRREGTWISCTTHSSPAIDCVGETDASVQILFDDIPVSYVQSFSSELKSTQTIVFGERGTMQLDYDAATVATHDGEEQTIANPYRRGEAMFRSLSRLLHAIKDGGLPSNSGEDNLKTIALLDGAYRSATERRPVTLEGGASA